MHKGLTALAVGTFALGIAEFMMMGILTKMGEDMGVSVAQAGNFISFYALGVCIGAPALLFARRMRLKTLMLLLGAIIAIGNAMAALSPGYNLFCIARLISGLPHGAYFGVGAIVARKLAQPGKEAGAVAYMISGMTVATLAGVPVGTFICNNLDWRVAFWLVSFFGILTTILIALWVPQVEKLPDMGFRGQFTFLRHLPAWLIFGGVIFGQIGIYCWYSYIDPQLTEVAGFPAADLTWLMVLAGLGMFLGNLIAGAFANRYAPALVGAWVQTAAIPVLILFYFFAGIQGAAIALMMLGTAALFGSGSPLQSDIVGYARGGEMLGAALIQIAYNAGNAIAARIGGTVIHAGNSYTTTSLVGLPVLAVGCAMLFILYRRYERPSHLK
ncbi:MAG: MFS transporter [Bacteroidales bacterium]|nr:MFS transporter [Bacteroidales bacterium]